MIQWRFLAYQRMQSNACHMDILDSYISKFQSLQLINCKKKQKTL